MPTIKTLREFTGAVKVYNEVPNDNKEYLFTSTAQLAEGRGKYLFIFQNRSSSLGCAIYYVFVQSSGTEIVKIIASGSWTSYSFIEKIEEGLRVRMNAWADITIIDLSDINVSYTMAYI